MLHPRVGRPVGSRNRQPSFGLDTKTFGIPWEFEYRKFKATNTCAVDSTLTALYLLSRHGGLSEAAEIEILRKVMVLLEEEKYGEARFHWCTTVLGRSSTGFHDLYGSIEDSTSVDNAKLFRFSTSCESHCGSDFCPIPHFGPDHKRSITKRTTMYTPAQCERFTQDVLNELLQDENSEPCNVPVPDEEMQGKPSDSFRTMRLFDDDNKDAGVAYQCTGTRKYTPRQVETYPILFQVTVPGGSSASADMTSKPETTIKLGEKEYKLVAIIYSVIGRKTFQLSCAFERKGSLL